MKNEKTYQVENWHCSRCNAQNRVSMRRCPECGAEMPNEFLMDVYRYEIERQNRAYAKEEKNIRMVVVLFIVVVGLLPVLFTSQLRAPLLYFLGLFAGVCYSNLTRDYMLNNIDYSKVRIKTLAAYIIMMVALSATALSLYTWHVYVKLSMVIFAVANVITMVKSKKTFNPVIIQTVLLFLLG